MPVLPPQTTPEIAAVYKKLHTLLGGGVLADLLMGLGSPENIGPTPLGMAKVVPPEQFLAKLLSRAPRAAKGPGTLLGPIGRQVGEESEALLSSTELVVVEEFETALSAAASQLRAEGTVPAKKLARFLFEPTTQRGLFNADDAYWKVLGELQRSVAQDSLGLRSALTAINKMITWRSLLGWGQ